MSDLTLPQRLLVRIGQISQRGDVIVQQQSRPRSSRRIGKWQSKLPADMFAFYKVINGLNFHYVFADAPDHWHGLELVALEDDGRKTIDTLRNRYRVPYQAAKRYPEYFFGAGEVNADTRVLFFFGSSDAWGVLMLGEGESASFHHWNNDGFVKHLSGSFTEVIERLMARGFAHTWAYSDTHPDTDDVMRRLAVEVPPRKTFEVTVESLTERSSSDYRRALVASFSDEVHDNVIRALGLTKQAKGISREEKISLIEGACASLAPITEKVATSIMKAIGYGKRDREELGVFFRCDAGPVAYVRLRLEHIQGPPPRMTDNYTLTRVLHSIDGFHVTDGFPHPSEVLSFTDPGRQEINWSPFIACGWSHGAGDEGNKVATCDLVIDASRAQGMEVGKTYASSALTTVEWPIG